MLAAFKLEVKLEKGGGQAAHLGGIRSLSRMAGALLSVFHMAAIVMACYLCLLMLFGLKVGGQLVGKQLIWAGIAVSR